MKKPKYEYGLYMKTPIYEDNLKLKIGWKMESIIQKFRNRYYSIWMNQLSFFHSPPPSNLYHTRGLKNTPLFVSLLGFLKSYRFFYIGTEIRFNCLFWMKNDICSMFVCWDIWQTIWKIWYQPSSAGGTRSPPAKRHQLEHPNTCKRGGGRKKEKENKDGNSGH